MQTLDGGPPSPPWGIMAHCCPDAHWIEPASVVAAVPPSAGAQAEAIWEVAGAGGLVTGTGSAAQVPEAVGSVECPLNPPPNGFMTAVHWPAVTIVSGGVPKTVEHPVLSPSAVIVHPIPASGAEHVQAPHVAGPPSGFVWPRSCVCSAGYAPVHPAPASPVGNTICTNPFHPLGIASTHACPGVHIGPGVAPLELPPSSPASSVTPLLLLLLLLLDDDALLP
jgi:hypothetical protein